MQQGLLLDMKVTETSQSQGYGNGALGQVSNLECYGKSWYDYSKADIVLVQVLIVLQIFAHWKRYTCTYFKLKFLCKIFIRLPYWEVIISHQPCLPSMNKENDVIFS